MMPLSIDRFNMRKIPYLFVILILFVSCNGVDMEQLRQHATYLAEIDGAQWVVCFDDVSGDQVSGRAYKADKLVADKHPFTARVGKRSFVISVPGVAENVTVRAKVKGGRIVCKGNGNLVKNIEIRSLDTPPYKSFHAQYDAPAFKVKVKKDVTYARAEGYWSSYPDTDEGFARIYARRVPELMSGPESMELKMDIYEPEGDKSARRPLMVLIHGGAFFNGDKQDGPIVKWCRHYASLGYVVVSPNYRMGFVPSRESIDKAGYRATQDVHAAVRYMLHRASDYCINPDWLFVAGSSAGAITALNVAFMRDKDRPETVRDEGPVTKLLPECKEKVKVRAVGNMWGAVVDTLILKNSPNTSIISFHGDADNIVPYGHDYPFKNIVQSGGKISEGLRQIFSFKDKQTTAPEDQLITKMYGSKCIDQYARRHGMRSRLFTAKGKGHSLHVDDHRNIVPYFYTIQDSMAKFFYQELVPVPLNLRHPSRQSLEIMLDKSNVAELYWKVTGGVLLEETHNTVRVLFFGDEPKRLLTVSGRYKNGVEFSKTVKY